MSRSPSSSYRRDSSCGLAGQELATANSPTNDRRLGLSPALQRRLPLHRLDHRSGTKTRTPSSRHRKQVHGQSPAGRARAQNPNERPNVRPPRGSTDQTTVAITEARSHPRSHAGVALTQSPNELEQLVARAPPGSGDAGRRKRSRQHPRGRVRGRGAIRPLGALRFLAATRSIGRSSVLIVRSAAASSQRRASLNCEILAAHQSFACCGSVAS